MSQPVQRFLRLGIERVRADRQFVPGAGLGIELEGCACGPELAHQTGVSPRAARGGELDQRVEPVEVGGRLAITDPKFRTSIVLDAAKCHRFCFSFNGRFALAVCAVSIETADP